MLRKYLYRGLFLIQQGPPLVESPLAKKKPSQPYAMRLKKSVRLCGRATEETSLDQRLKPRFLFSSVSQGRLNLSCTDPQTKEWLKEITSCSRLSDQSPVEF
ncbi:hypothetical protein JTB14_011441 [Gonioctena quinquepunctata]|nr:hypothetical protein JTB14_011441 [Gonioctena quinquepunctata]